MTQGTRLRSAVRKARHAGLIAFAVAATALADGQGPPLRVASYSNEVEGSLVRAIVNLRQEGLKAALSDVDEMLARNPNYKLGYLIKGDLLMASAGQPVAFASRGAPQADVLPLQDEARVRVQRYVDAPPTSELPASLLQLAPKQQHALVIDTSHSRLFVFANDLGRPRPPRRPSLRKRKPRGPRPSHRLRQPLRPPRPTSPRWSRPGPGRGARRT